MRLVLAIYSLCALLPLGGLAQYIRFNNEYYLDDNVAYVIHPGVMRNDYLLVSGDRSQNLQHKITHFKFDLEGNVLDTSEYSIGTGYFPHLAHIDFGNKLLITRLPGPSACSLLSVAYSYVAMIGDDMQPIWQRHFTDWDDVDYCRETWINCMTKYNDDKAFIISRITISGNTNSLISPQFSGFKFVVLDSDGHVLHDHEEIEEIQTTKRYRYNNVKQLDGDTFLVWGTVTLTANNPLNPYGVENDQAFIRKIDLYGNNLGTVFLGGPLNERGTTFIELQNGNLLAMYSHVISGNNWNNVTEVRTVEIDLLNMSIVSQNTIPAPWSDGINMTQADVGFKPECASDNGCLVRGVYSIYNTGDYKALLGFYNYEGYFEWYNTYNSELATSPPDIPRITFVKKAPDGGYYAGGSIQHIPAPGQLIGKPWLFKIDACGDLVDNGCPATVGISEQAAAPTFTAWPNPTTGILHANLPEEAIRVEWLDMTGRMVHTERTFYPKQTFNLAALAPGNYLMRVVLQDGTSIVQRMVRG